MTPKDLTTGYQFTTVHKIIKINKVFFFLKTAILKQVHNDISDLFIGYNISPSPFLLENTVSQIITKYGEALYVSINNKEHFPTL